MAIISNVAPVTFSFFVLVSFCFSFWSQCGDLLFSTEQDHSPCRDLQNFKIWTESWKHFNIAAFEMIRTLKGCFFPFLTRLFSFWIKVFTLGLRFPHLPASSFFFSRNENDNSVQICHFARHALLKLKTLSHWPVSSVPCSFFRHFARLFWNQTCQRKTILAIECLGSTKKNQVLRLPYTYEISWNKGPLKTGMSFVFSRQDEIVQGCFYLFVLFCHLSYHHVIFIILGAKVTEQLLPQLDRTVFLDDLNSTGAFYCSSTFLGTLA